MRVSPKVLTEDERSRVLDVFKTWGHNIRILIHGEGEDRKVSFYAEGTRMEAQVSCPEVNSDGEPQEG